LRNLNLKDIFIFIKFRIAFSVAISSLVGYFLSASEINLDIVYLFVAVLLLASGSGALNEAQEWWLDAKMDRTAKRPIPLGKLFPVEGTLFSVGLIFLGLVLLLYFAHNSIPFILGVSAVLIYNAIYTPLKRISPYAAFPGAFIGAIPPAIGWTFAGGALMHPQNLALMTFFFIWQMPHFWLLLILFESDYRKAGFPLLTDKLTTQQISRISFMWIIALVFCGLSIPFFGEKFSIATFPIMLVLGVYLLIRCSKLLLLVQPNSFYRTAFIQLNAFVLFVMILLSVNRFLNF
jgi:protoheme IX farnesyltransferase